MKQNTFYKKNTTPAEREELFQWFEQHMQVLPQSIEIPGLKIPDVPFTARRIIQSLRLHLKNAPIFEGQFSLLKMIQDHVRKSPGFQE